MHLRRRLQTLLAGSLLWVLAAGSAAGDLLLLNGRIFTGEPLRPYAEAMALRDDRILAVGNRSEVMRAVPPGTESVDLGGGFLMPGLIDSHIHAVDGGLSLISADVADNVASIEALAQFAVAAKASGRGMQGDILVVTGIPLALWTQIPELQARFGSGEFAAQPLLLHGMDGHSGWANPAMLARAKIDRPWIAGLDAAGRGYYGHGPDLEPNGFLADAGLYRVTALIPAPDRARMHAAGRAALAHLHALGITAWLDPVAPDPILASYRDMAEAGELSARVVALPTVDFSRADPDAQLAQAVARREEFRTLQNIRVGGIKVFADGVVEYPSQTAYLSKPYLPRGNNGELLFRPEDFARIATAADRQGMIVHVHAIGDQAVTEALNGIAAARAANAKPGPMHAITHVQLIRAEDTSRFRELNVAASFQLLWARGAPTTIGLLKPYLDPALYARLYPARSVLDAGGLIAGASDWPVSTANVFHAIYRAETRQGPEGVLNAAERVPREAMLYAYTCNAAQSLGEGARIGSLAAGKLADFVLLDRDVLTVSAEEARDTTVRWTVVGGKTVYGSKP